MDASNLFCEVSKTLAHAELAFTNKNYSYDSADFKVRCVPHILCKEFGVETENLSFPVADFNIPNEWKDADPQEIRAELSETGGTAYNISARMARSLEQNKAPHHTKQEPLIVADCVHSFGPQTGKSSTIPSLLLSPKGLMTLRGPRIEGKSAEMRKDNNPLVLCLFGILLVGWLELLVTSAAHGRLPEIIARFLAALGGKAAC